MNSHFNQVYTELSEQYSVPDLLTPSSRLIFLLESPHVQELKYGAPVSGSSGSTMSKHLFGEQYAKFPLGLLLKKNKDEHKDRPSLNTIGLMNVCQIPMQRAAYRSAEIVQKYDEFLQILEGIRTANAKSSFKQPDWNDVQDLLVQGLRKKMISFAERECVWVPCGRFAQKFFKLTGTNSSHWAIIDEVPHPSYNSWDRQTYKQVIDRVKSEFERLKQAGDR